MNLFKNELIKIFKGKFIYIGLLAVILVSVISLRAAYIDYEDNKREDIVDNKQLIQEQISVLEKQLKTARDEEKKGIQDNINLYNHLLENDISLNSWKVDALRNYYITADEYYAYKNGERNYTYALDPALCYEYVQKGNYIAYMELEKSNLKFIADNGYGNLMTPADQIIKMLELYIKYNVEPDRDSWKRSTLADIMSDRNRANDPDNDLSGSQRKYLLRKADQKEYRVIHDLPQYEIFSLFDSLHSDVDIAVIILLIISVLAGSSVTDEYIAKTKRTLYTYPYKRWKILVAKFMSINIAGLILIFIGFFASLTAGLILFGTEDIGLSMVFSIKSGVDGVISLNVIVFTFILYLLTMTEVAMITMFCLALSSVFKKSYISITSAVLLTFLSKLSAFMLEGTNKVRLIRFLLPMVMNFRPYFLGKNIIPGLNSGTSAIAYIIWFSLFAFFLYYRECLRDID